MVLVYRPALLLAVALLLLLETGCSVPASLHPLSDDETSEVDEKLVGYWQVIDEDTDRDDPPPPPFTVARKPGTRATMESIYVEINGEKELKVERNLLFTSKVGEQSFISWQQVDDDTVNYVIAAYEFTRKGRLQVLLMDEDKVIEAIEQGRMDGEVVIRTERDKNGVETQHKSGKITASPTQLRRVLSETGLDLFDQDEPMEFKRYGK